jgi:hypothetical protein
MTGGRAKDPLWKHGILGANKGDIQCIHCSKRMTSGISRLKYHLAKIPCNDITPCLECPEEATREAMASLQQYAKSKAAKKRVFEAMAAPMGTFSSTGSQTGAESSSIVPRIWGSGSVSGSLADFWVPHNTPGAQPGLLGTAWNKEMHEKTKVAIMRFWVRNNLSFNALCSPYWDQVVTSISLSGKGFKSPTPYEASGPLLDDEVTNIHQLVEEKRRVWEHKGCTIISDGWTDGRNRTLINFLVASGGQLVFLKSVDASDQVKNAENLCNMLDEVVIEVGVANVIQIVTNNAAAYVAAGRLLMERHPTLFWSPCVAHCLDLLLEDLGKLSWVEKVVEDGRNIAKYIYNHTWVLSLMREHTSGKDLVRAGVTRFATNFLNLQSISETLLDLRHMFLDKKWLESPYAKKPEAEKIVRIVFDGSFEKLMEETLKVSFQILIDDLEFNFEIFSLADFVFLIMSRYQSRW